MYTRGEEMGTGCRSGNLKERGYLEELSIGGKIMLKWI